MGEFVFNEEIHRYTLDGVVLPSVTQILKPLYDFSAVNPDVLARAAAFGTAVHKTVELYLHDDLNEADLDENLRGPLNAFKQWCSDKPSLASGIVNIEKPGYHAKLKYAGTPDLEGDFVADLKSRKCNPFVDALQLLMYDHMTGNGKRFHLVIELKQDGTYVQTMLNHTDKERKQNWLRCRYLLDYYNMGEELKRWKM